MQTNESLVGRQLQLDRVLSKTAHRLYLVEEDGGRDPELLGELKREARHLWAISAQHTDHRHADLIGAHLRSALADFVHACADAEHRGRGGGEARVARVHDAFSVYVRAYRNFKLTRRAAGIELRHGRN